MWPAGTTWGIGGETLSTVTLAQRSVLSSRIVS